MPTGVYIRTKEHLAKMKEYGFQKGKHYSQETEFKKGYKQGKGKANPNWKGGRTADANGYILIKSKKHPNKNNQEYVLEHRLVVEQHLGRYLDPQETVHHVNGDVKDNRLQNLRVFPNQSKHLEFHNAMS